MNKHEFLAQLRKGLCGLPQADIEEHLTFYGEMIDDRMEEGFSEEEAVSAIGSVDEIVAQAVAETPLMTIAKERIRSNRRTSAGEILLLALGSPIWLSLGIAVFAVILSFYASIWAVIISLWAVFISLAACSVGGILMCFVHCIGTNFASGAMMLAFALICSGLSIFIFFGCKAASKGTFGLTKKITILIKNCFIRKEHE